MRVVVQRVSKASVTIDGVCHASIEHGYLVLAGVETEDSMEDAQWLSGKVAQLRIMADEQGYMNKDIAEVGGSILVVSQFTLHASYKKGNRPSFLRAAKPDQAIPILDCFVSQLAEKTRQPIKTGVFGADMKVDLLNDGPVTILMDSRNRE